MNSSNFTIFMPHNRCDWIYGFPFKLSLSRSFDLPTFPGALFPLHKKYIQNNPHFMPLYLGLSWSTEPPPDGNKIASYSQWLIFESGLQDLSRSPLKWGGGGMWIISTTSFIRSTSDRTGRESLDWRTVSTQVCCLPSQSLCLPDRYTLCW